ncbi:agmatine deiminase family protein [Limnoglobus roseus]|uniref:Agmatine deiminase family protein n=2 Tax=Limnoglobus roseus TaxID=2598579 RepID=A0A5C1AEL3_9BACT|nr:agmatine deiminase family protein [Limnoglobus roseus]
MATVSPSFRMPAEWEPHAGTWLAWPHRTSDWPGKFGPIPWVYGEIIRTLARYETVNVIVRDADMKERAAAILKRVHADTANVKLHTIRTDRSWVRDSGPIFAYDKAGKKTALDWHFNAWAKYPDWRVDDKLPGIVAKKQGVPAVQPTYKGTRIVLEGGSIDVNGAGLLLTTEECLLSEVQQRNPALSRADYEAAFAQYLGVKRVIWLNRGIDGDDTHGHIDDLARFTSTNTIVTVVEKNEADENFAPLQENLERLKATKLTIVPLPMPSPVIFRKQRIPASYANFYIANGVVIVPTFNDPQDRHALGTLAELFPDRDVVGIHCVDLVWGLGTLHCMTQQEPK